MAYLRKDNVTLQEDDKGKIKELEVRGYKVIDEPKKPVKKQAAKKEEKKESEKASSK